VTSLKHAMPLLVVAGLLSLFAAACGGSSSNAGASSTAAQSSIDALTARVQRDEMLNAWIAASAIPIHDQDTIVQGGKIDGKYVPALRTLIRVLALTDFSPAVKPAAQQLHDDAVALLQALDAGKDAATVGPMSAKVHAESDKFNPALGSEVAKDLPVDAGGPVPTPPGS
jgi:hypothetical protein